MAFPPPPPEAVAAAKIGRKMDAIKHYRQGTGVTLKEANDWYESLDRAREFPVERKPMPPFVIPPEAGEAMRRGNLFEAARITRAAFVAYIHEANARAGHVRPASAVSSARTTTPTAMPKPRLPHSSGQVEATPFRHAPGLSPGEIPRGSGAGVWVPVVLIGVALMVALFFTR